jgi:hypothetical protein
MSKIVYYFFDWEIRDADGNHVKWANGIVEAPGDVAPPTVFDRAKNYLYDSMGLPSTYHARAISFHKI